MVVSHSSTGKPLSVHGSTSPEVMRPSLIGNVKSRANQLQCPSPQDIKSASYSPVTNPSSGTYSGTASVNGLENLAQSSIYNRPKEHDSSSSGAHDPSVSNTASHKPQRHPSFGFMDSVKQTEIGRPVLQTSVGPYGLISSGSSSSGYQSGVQASSSPQPFVSQRNFTPFSLPPPGYTTTTTTTTTAPLNRDSEHSYSTSSSRSMNYQNDLSQHHQSGPDMVLLDQMTAPNTMPVFGGEGYNRSPFAIPEDFVAYLFSNQLVDNSPNHTSPISQQSYARLVYIS